MRITREPDKDILSIFFYRAKFPDVGSDIGSSQFSMLPQLSTKILLNSSGQNWAENNHVASLI